MVGRIAASIGLVCLTLTFGAIAAGTDDDVMAGRAMLFEGAVAGFAEAYQIFDAAVENGHGSDDTDDRELVFLHALTRAVVLFHDYGDIVSADRFFALAEEFGISLAQSTLADFKAVLSLGSCKGPVSSAPGGNGPRPRDFVLMELSDIIVELDSISDAPTPFAVCFTPQETGLTGPVEVDYGEVLILKGLLLAYQAELEAQTARILNGDPETARLDGCFVESVLGTETTGAATETDPQEDELLYLCPDARTQMKPVQARLRAWRRSLQVRTSGVAV